jgi:hypothetical protein
MRTNQFNETDVAFSAPEMMQVMSPDGRLSLNKLFTYYFNCLPNKYEVGSVNERKMMDEICSFYSDFIIKTFENKQYDAKMRLHMQQITIVLFSSAEMLVFDRDKLTYYYDKEELLSKKYLRDEAHRYCRIKENKPEIQLIVSGFEGLELSTFEIEKNKLDLFANYNEDMTFFNTEFISTLNDTKKRGIHFLYGKPGTGKTNYIRHVLSYLKKNVIFIPSGMADSLSDPSFVSLLIQQAKGQVLVIEDAEKAILSRDAAHNTAVSTLLNISDGLLSDVLNLQIICTFNTEIRNVDDALLRPGRLLSKYEFKELEVEKANRLSAQLGFGRKFNGAAALAEVYNNRETQVISLQTKRAVGF